MNRCEVLDENQEISQIILRGESHEGLKLFIFRRKEKLWESELNENLVKVKRKKTFTPENEGTFLYETFFRWIQTIFSEDFEGLVITKNAEEA